jgi:hypothetical protein
MTRILADSLQLFKGGDIRKILRTTGGTLHLDKSLPRDEGSCKTGSVKKCCLTPAYAYSTPPIRRRRWRNITPNTPTPKPTSAQVEGSGMTLVTTSESAVAPVPQV